MNFFDLLLLKKSIKFIFKYYFLKNSNQKILIQNLLFFKCIIKYAYQIWGVYLKNWKSY